MLVALFPRRVFEREHKWGCASKPGEEFACLAFRFLSLAEAIRDDMDARRKSIVNI